MRNDWMEYKAIEFGKMDPMRTIAVFPTAAVEQHGPHLPVGTDAMIGAGMLAEACPLIPGDLDVRVLPIQAVGKSNEHMWAAGTLTLAAETALRAWTEIGLSVARAAVRKIVIVSSHGGNLDIVSIVARELRVQAGLYVVKCQWSNFGYPEGMYSEREMQFGIHGGDVETSLMLHFRPELVDMGAVEDFSSAAENEAISPTGPINYGWVAKDLNPKGVVGNAALANAEKGAATARHQARGFADLLTKIAEAPLDRFSPAEHPD